MAASSQWVYLNGRIVPRAEARLDVEDRGTQFGDGVYEVLCYYGGKSFGMAGHLARIQRSLGGIELAVTDEVRRLDQISDDLVRRNNLLDAKVYWQITRGSAPRNHLIPDDIKPSVLVMASAIPPLAIHAPPRPLKAILFEDHRWLQCWIKSLMLLPNALAKTRAVRAGADEAILHRGDIVTEGSSTNVFAVRGGEIFTHPADERILGGITRDTVLTLARQMGLICHEQHYRVTELLACEEVFITGTSTHVAAIVRINGSNIGDGRPGPVSCRLYAGLMAHMARECGLSAAACSG